MIYSLVIVNFALLYIFVGVVIGFDPNIYEVSEEDDRFVNITVRVLEGQLQRDVMVQFDTDDDSALSGMCPLHKSSNYIL